MNRPATAPLSTERAHITAAGREALNADRYLKLRRMLFENPERVEALRCLSPSAFDAELDRESFR